MAASGRNSKSMAGNRSTWFTATVLAAGVLLRYALTLPGYNWDVVSYDIVGQIAANGGNVYAETTRYNYAPIFMQIEALAWRIGQLTPYPRQTLRLFIMTLLTLTDIGIFAYVKKKAGLLWAALFFLNPVTLIITGYHNQFDNMAVLVSFLAAECMIRGQRGAARAAETKINNHHGMGSSIDQARVNQAGNNRAGVNQTGANQAGVSWNRWDTAAIALLTLSLCVKHLLYAYPAWLLFTQRLPRRKKPAYVILPPLLFLASFLPYWKDGSAGILSNVFLYRSDSNYPLLAQAWLKAMIHTYQGIPHPLLVFIALMLLAAWLLRREMSDRALWLYFLCLVSFSSAIANQYLAIPCASLALLLGTTRAKNGRILSGAALLTTLYFLMEGIYLCLNLNGLQVLGSYPRETTGLAHHLAEGMYMYPVAAWLLLLLLIMYGSRKGGSGGTSLV